MYIHRHKHTHIDRHTYIDRTGERQIDRQEYSYHEKWAEKISCWQQVRVTASDWSRRKTLPGVDSLPIIYSYTFEAIETNPRENGSRSKWKNKKILEKWGKYLCKNEESIYVKWKYICKNEESIYVKWKYLCKIREVYI